MNENVILGHAVHDENGKSVGGKAGDQLQKETPDYAGEVCLRKFYKNSKGWFVIRAIKKKHANKLAKYMKRACNNVHIGYSQSDRYGIIRYGTKTKTDCNADCSSLVRECVKEATKKDPGDFTTDSEVKTLEATGLFDKAFGYDDTDTLYTGDILVTKTKGHTVIVVEGEPRENTYVEPNMPVTSSFNAEKYNLTEYSFVGEYVKWVQHELCRVGYQKEIDLCGGIDGQCGSGTVRCIAKFQKLKDLPETGICDKRTRKALKKAKRA